MVIGDLVAIISLVGTGILFLGSPFIKKITGRMLEPGLFSLLMGIGLQFCFMNSSLKNNPEGFILRTPASTINFLLIISFSLLIGAFTLKGLIGRQNKDN